MQILGTCHITHILQPDQEENVTLHIVTVLCRLKLVVTKSYTSIK